MTVDEQWTAKLRAMLADVERLRTAAKGWEYAARTQDEMRSELEAQHAAMREIVQAVADEPAIALTVLRVLKCPRCPGSIDFDLALEAAPNNAREWAEQHIEHAAGCIREQARALLAAESAVAE